MVRDVGVEEQQVPRPWGGRKGAGVERSSVAAIQDTGMGGGDAGDKSGLVDCVCVCWRGGGLLILLQAK